LECNTIFLESFLHQHFHLVPHGQSTQDTQCGEEIALHLTI